MCHFKGKYMKFRLVQNYTTMSAMGVYFKMADFTGAERAKCVLWYENSQSATTVQRNFRTHYHKRPPTRPTIYSWHRNFIASGCSVTHNKSPGRPSVSDATVEQVRESFVRSPSKSTRRASRDIGISHVTVWRVLRRRLHP